MTRNRRGERRGRVRAPAALGSALIGATLLFPGEDAEPPAAGGTPANGAARTNPGEPMPAPGFGARHASAEPGRMASRPAAGRGRVVRREPAGLAVTIATAPEPSTDPASDGPQAQAPAGSELEPADTMAVVPAPPAARLALQDVRPSGTASGPAPPRPANAKVPVPAAAITPPAAATRTGFVPAAPFTADDELVLAVEAGQGAVSDTITAYGTRAGTYLPLGELARLLDLAIVVSDDGAYASGWVLDEQHVVTVSVHEGVMRSGGRDLALAPGDAAAFDGELYLRADRFAELMPLALKVDLRTQAVAVTTRVPFPFEQRAARETARVRLAGHGVGQGGGTVPREETPWRAQTFPLADVELRGLADSALGTRGEADLRLAGDLAFMTARLYASASTRDGLIAARIELGRRDPEGGLLGPLHATEFEIGDIATTALPLGLRGVGGRGAMVTNAPLERLSVFDKLDLRGELPAGYEAELYRNNSLVGATAEAVNGQYQFLQVAVEFGLNVFRLVLYGPQGQRREQVRRISVGDGRLGKGEFRYSLGLVQQDVNLLAARGANFVPSLDYGAWRSAAMLQYGVATALTATLGGGWTQSQGGDHWLVTAGLRSGLGGMAARLDVGVEDGGGRALSVGMGGRLAGASWTASHLEATGAFIDETRAFTSEPLRRASELDLNATLRFGPPASPRVLPLTGQLRRLQFADGRSEIEGSLRASLPLSRLLVSNALSIARLATPGGGAGWRLSGTFDLATLAGTRTQYRASLDYRLAPDLRLAAAQVEVDRAFGRDTLVKAAVGRILDSGETTLALSAVRRFARFSLAFDGNLALRRRAYAAGLRLGFSLGRNPIGGSFFVARPGLASGGAVAVRAWQDDNGNHRYDPGEPLLPGIAFGTGLATGRTDARGVALIGAIGDGTRTEVRLDDTTLPDIGMAPQHEGIAITPRAGRIHVSDFAVDLLGEIEGTAYFGTAGRGVSGVMLQLFDTMGNIVAQARTEGGGSFLFERVRPGAYRVGIEPGQAQRLGITLLPPQAIEVGAKAGLRRIDLRIGQLPATTRVR